MAFKPVDGHKNISEANLMADNDIPTMIDDTYVFMHRQTFERCGELVEEMTHSYDDDILDVAAIPNVSVIGI